MPHSKKYIGHMTNQVVNPATIAEAVRDALSESGLTMNSLSMECGISYPTLRRHLVSRPDLLTMGQISAISRALNVSVDSLFTPHVPNGAHR